MTRTGDNFVSRAERIAIANQHPDAIFVSIHANGTSPGSSVSGMETFFPGMGADDSNSEDEKAETIRRARSVSLAVALHTLTLYKGKCRDLGVKGRRLDVITGIRIPGVLIEAGFLSNESEAKRLRTPDAVDALVHSLHDGLRNYRLAIHGGR